MSRIQFSRDEYLILAMFRRPSRLESIEMVAETLPYIEEDGEIKQLVGTVLQKLYALTDDEYLLLNLEPYVQEAEEEESGE